MWIELEVGGNPLHDGHGTALAAGRAFELHAAAVPAEDGIDEDARDRAQQAAIVGESRAQGVRNGEDELSEPDGGNDGGMNRRNGNRHQLRFVRLDVQVVDAVACIREDRDFKETADVFPSKHCRASE